MTRYRRIGWRITQAVLAASCVLVGVLALNLWRFESRQMRVAAVPPLDLAEGAVVERLAAAIRFDTVSRETTARMDAEPFEQFASFLEQSFPRVHATLTRYSGAQFGDPDNLSILYKWEGKGDDDGDAILLMAHYDVVAVEANSRTRWTHWPFEGHVDDQYIWGRGTLDVKNGVVGWFEAIEYLLARGFQPNRTIYLSLGHDEEVGGFHGNKRISQWMRREGIRLDFVLDEGGCIYTDFPGIERPVALIGIAEKGYVTLYLTAEVPDGGHASMPPPRTPVDIVAQALARLRRHPFPRRLDGGAGHMLDFVGPEMQWPNRLALSNRWLFAPVVKEQLGATPSGNASLRTTIAPTMIEGGIQENVLPTRAQAVVNVRILPGDTVQGVIDHVTAAINDDRIAITTGAIGKDPSRLSSTRSDAFAALHQTINQIFPDTVVAPFVVLGGTDASHFDDPSFSRNVYRFIPAKLGSDDLQRIHGVNERISRDGYLDIIRFNIQLIKNVANR